MQPVGDYCSFEKAAEHLADRWVFLIARELAMHGPLGFNALADALPGVSRSVLSRRLRKLQDLGLIVRDSADGSRSVGYKLAPAGQHLVPTLMSLNNWAERWIPEDPAVVQHDPDVITFWISRRVDGKDLPQTPAVLVFQLGGSNGQQAWLVLQRGAEPSLCLEDPLLPAERYVYVEADANALYPISRGDLGWHEAIARRDVHLYGEPKLLRAVPDWFEPAG